MTPLQLDRSNLEVEDMQITQVIKRPVITEKSHRLISEQNEYTLVVAKKANKSLVKKAVENLFGVKVLRVRIINSPSKTRRAGKWRRERQTSGFKKAIVKLEKEQKIPLFELEAEKEKEK